MHSNTDSFCNTNVCCCLAFLLPGTTWLIHTISVFDLLCSNHWKSMWALLYFDASETGFVKPSKSRGSCNICKIDITLSVHYAKYWSFGICPCLNCLLQCPNHNVLCFVSQRRELWKSLFCAESWRHLIKSLVGA
jgi:hypothetical protein